MIWEFIAAWIYYNQMMLRVIMIKMINRFCVYLYASVANERYPNNAWMADNNNDNHREFHKPITQPVYAYPRS